MSKATELANKVMREVFHGNPLIAEAATLLRQQDAVIKQCVEALQHARGILNHNSVSAQSEPLTAAIATAKELT